MQAVSAVRPLVPSVVHDSHPFIPSMFPSQKWTSLAVAIITLSIHSSPLEYIGKMFFRYTDLHFETYNLMDSVRAVLKVVLIFIIH
jgi:hypothetical protein